MMGLGSRAAAPPLKKNPAIEISQKGRSGTARIGRSSGADFRQRDALLPQRKRAYGGNAQHARSLHNKQHGECALLGHAEQTEGENPTDDEAARDLCKVSEDNQESKKNHDEEI